jgi:hypothetical protein
MTASDFERILDECIDRINRGEPLEACLAHYPEYAERLKPLLLAMSQTKGAYSFSPDVNIKRKARQHFYALLDRRTKPSFWQRILAHRAVLVTVTTVFIFVALGLFALKSAVFVTPPPLITIPAPSADGNFAFLVSDEVNAITDFSSLYVTVEKVELLQTGNSTNRVGFTPAVKEFDLTLLPGGKTQELWRGNVPEGEYSKVVLYVSQVRGVLRDTGAQLDIKLPSNKLQISEAFRVTSGNVTSFTYDLTVVKTGNAANGGKYILKPQASGSGATQEPISNRGKGKTNRTR